ncbi:MAG: S9 family peptidase [Clostridia bacterium]|nr:S9 family peptidase [Clostridia bacterium]
MKTISMDQFQNYRFLSGVSLAPHGEDAAFLCAKTDMARNAYDTDLWLLPADSEARRLTTDGKSGGFLWDNDSTLLFSSRRDPEIAKKAEAGESCTAFYRLNLHGGEAEKAFSVPLAASLVEKVANGVYLLRADWDLRFSKANTMKGDAKAALLAEKKAEQDYEVLDELPFYFNGQGFINKHRSALFLFDEKTGKLTRVTKETFAAGGAQLSADRSQILITGQNYTVKRGDFTGVYVYDIPTGKTRTLLRPTRYDLYGAWWFGEKILLLGTDQKRYGSNENARFYTLDPADGAVSLFADFDDAVGSSVGSDCRLGGGKSIRMDGGKLYFTATLRNASHVLCLDAAGTITPVFEQEGSVDCFDVRENKLTFIGMQNMALQEIYTYDGTRTQRTALNTEALAGCYVAMPEKLTYLNDGMDLDGWVLLPKDFDPAKTYPAILDIHGGPKTVYGEVFYHEMQLWANMGYFVFFCNPRGGDGRGNAFADIRGKYGTIDYDDIMAFCDAVLEKYPQIDPARVGVTGGSYGGFMTNWIIGHTDRFKAAASQRSISNWISFCFTSDIGEGFARDQMGLTGKMNPWDNREKLWFHSPLAYAQNCNTPTLFIHSDEDFRCPLSEGYQMYSALLQLGVEARMCVFHGENHELSRGGKPQHRLRRLQEITDWFEKHL